MAAIEASRRRVVDGLDLRRVSMGMLPALSRGRGHSDARCIVGGGRRVVTGRPAVEGREHPFGLSCHRWITAGAQDRSAWPKSWMKMSASLTSARRSFVDDVAHCRQGDGQMVAAADRSRVLRDVRTDPRFGLE
jgi:hypothetical protein